MLERYLRPPDLLPVVFIYITWHVVIPIAVKPLPSVFYIQYSLLSPTPYMCFSGSLHILFSFNLSSVLYYRGLHSGHSIPMLSMWIKYVPIIYSNSIVLGGVCGCRALCYI